MITKKLTCVLIAVIVAMTMSFSFSLDSASASSSKVKRLSYSTKSNMSSITVKWKKKKNIKKYVIYKKEVTKYMFKDDNAAAFKWKGFKKIAKTSGSNKSYTDRKVKKHHYYVYAVKAYKKVKGKNKLAYTTYIKDEYDSYSAACPGLGRPDLFNDGSGEFNYNTNSKFWLYTQTEYGVKPASIMLYRKAKGDTKYKKIKTVKYAYGKSISDSSVKPGKVYYYKIRTKIRYKGKTYYSKYSNIVRIPNFNEKPQFDIETISTGDVERYIKITSKKNNGILTFNTAQLYINDEEDEESTINIFQYSTDGVNWSDMGTKPIKLEAEGTIYLRLTGKSVATISNLTSTDGAVSYDGPWPGRSVMTFDFARGKATVSQFYD